MKRIGSAAGNDADDGTGSLSILRTIAVGQHLEFSNRFDRRIDKDGAVRTYVVVIGAIDKEQIVGRRVAID